MPYEASRGFHAQLCCLFAGQAKQKRTFDTAASFSFPCLHDDTGLTLESLGNFSSFRANTCVFSGKWMYEVVSVCLVQQVMVSVCLVQQVMESVCLVQQVMVKASTDRMPFQPIKHCACARVFAASLHLVPVDGRHVPQIAHPRRLSA